MVSSNKTATGSNPFDSDEEEVEYKKNLKRHQRPPGASPAPSSSAYSSARKTYKNDFRDSVMETRSVQELEDYAVSRAEETTNTINGCLRIAEEIKESGTQTLIALHHQGEQITRTHHVTVDIDHDLSRGEKLLGSLGGIFSKTWKPKKSRQISGPVITRGNASKVLGNHFEQKQKLGLNKPEKESATTRASFPEPTDALQKIEMEKAKQDDALTDLSNMLGEMKTMAIDMGAEIEWQTKAMDNFEEEVEEINSRLRGAKERGRRLLKN